MSPPDRSTVLFTGTTGLDKGVVLENLANYLCMTNGLPLNESIVERVNLEERIVRQTSASWSAFIQSYNARTRQSDWEETAENIAQIRGRTNHLFVSLHLTYCIKGEFISLVHLGPIENLQPTHIITLIDDIFEIWCRIARRDEERGTNFKLTLWQILAWRSAEIALAEMLARFLRIPHYVVSVKHPTRMLYKLLYHPELLPFYLSLPISNIRNNPENRIELDQMRQRVHDEIVAFDPLTIDEGVPTLFKLARQSELVEYSPLDPQCRWPFDPSGTLVENREDIFPYTIPSSEILGIESYVSESIPSRDYRLVDQAKVIAGYRPTYKGSPFSYGMLGEFYYANNASRPAKEIWVYSDEEDGAITHPFHQLGHLVTDFDQWLDRLKNYRL